MVSLPNPRPNNGSVPLTLAWLVSNTEDRGGCWHWLGSRDQKGYGVLRVKNRRARAHRLAYELAVGPVPAGLVLDHLCRTPQCCNPAHLEPVTNQENVRRGRSLRYVDGQCPACGSTKLYKRRYGHACADCRRAREASPARVEQRREYERKRGATPERKAQHRLACARYVARKRIDRGYTPTLFGEAPAQAERVDMFGGEP